MTRKTRGLQIHYRGISKQKSILSDDLSNDCFTNYNDCTVIPKNMLHSTPVSNKDSNAYHRYIKQKGRQN